MINLVARRHTRGSGRAYHTQLEGVVQELVSINSGLMTEIFNFYFSFIVLFTSLDHQCLSYKTKKGQIWRKYYCVPFLKPKWWQALYRNTVSHGPMFIPVCTHCYSTWTLYVNRTYPIIPTVVWPSLLISFQNHGEVSKCNRVILGPIILPLFGCQG